MTLRTMFLVGLLGLCVGGCPTPVEEPSGTDADSGEMELPPTDATDDDTAADVPDGDADKDAPITDTEPSIDVPADAGQDTATGDSEPASDVTSETTDGDAGSQPEIVISVPGDLCEAPIVIPANDLPFVYQGESSFAGNDYGLDGGCQTGGSIGVGAPDVVFALTPETSGWHIIGLSPASQIGNNPSAIYVVTDCEAVADSCVAVSSDLTAGGFFSAYLEAGTDYFIVADGLLADDAGGFIFTVDESVCVPACPGAGQCGRDLCGGFCGAGCNTETEACHPEQGVCLPPNDVPNDNCVGATLIDQLPATLNGDTYYGSNDYKTEALGCSGEPNPVGGASRDHIYTLQPTVTGVYTFTLTSEFDGVVYVATSCNVPESFCVGAADATTHTEVLEVTLNAGATYFVFVDGASNNLDQYGVYSLFIDAPCVPNCTGQQCGTDGCGGSCGDCVAGETCNSGTCEQAATGDHCLDPIVVSAVPYQDQRDTSDYGNDHSFAEEQCSGAEYGWGAGSNDVVYAFTAPDAEVYSFRVEADFDTVLYITTDCSDMGASCLVSADAPSSLSGETIDIALLAGQQVFAVVDGYGNISNPTGPYTFSIDLACTTDCDGRECGDDGCGGSCGDCLPSETCSPQGQCGEPLGNSCANPFTIDSVPFEASGDTSEASPVHGYPYDGCGEQDIYARGVTSSDQVYAFTPDVTGVYTIRVEAAFSASWYVVSDCTYFVNECFTIQEPGPIQWVKLTEPCVQDTYPCAGTQSGVTSPSAPQAPVLLEGGTTYFIIVDGYANNSDDSGAYTLTVSDPCFQQCEGKTCGDDSCGLTCGECELGLVCGDSQLCEVQVGNTCDDPFIVPAEATLPWVVSSNTSDATNVYGLPSNACPDQSNKSYGIGGNDHVYAFTPQEDGAYEFSLDADFLSVVYLLTACDGYPSDCYYVEAQGYNTWIAVTPGCSFPSSESVCVGLKGDKEETKPHKAKADLVAGTTYYVVVDGATALGNMNGTYTLTIDQACTPDCDGKECGDDGCGETCGSCPGGFTCTNDGQCVDLTSATGNSCEDPYIIDPAALPFLGVGDTLNDSDVYTPCAAGGDSDTRDEVWRFTPNQTGVYVITVNASFDAALSLGTDCAGVDFTCAEGTTGDIISTELTASTPYYIFVDGADAGAEGDYSLEVKLP